MGGMATRFIAGNAPVILPMIVEEDGKRPINKRNDD